MSERTAFEDEGELVVVIDYPFTRHGTMVTFTGTDGTGRKVTFGCDWRPAQGLIEALYADEQPIVSVEPWQVLTITEPEEAEPAGLTITVHPEVGTTVWADGQRVSTPAPTDLGLSDACNILHDAAHALLAAHAGLEGSPVLERVAGVRSLSQEQVDLEEAATFALQAWCAALRGEDHQPHIANVRAALERLP